MTCPNCGREMIRRRSKFRNSYWWGCSGYPECDYSANEHPDGTMMDYPAGGEIKALRKRAHELMVQVFGPWEQRTSKAAMYSWLRHQTKSGHIGKASKDELEKVIKFLEHELKG